MISSKETFAFTFAKALAISLHKYPDAPVITITLSSKLNISNTDLKSFLINVIGEKYYKKDSYIKDNIYKYIEFYFLKLINLNKSQNQIYLLYENFIKKIYYLKKFNLDEEAFFIELKTKILNG